MIGRSPALLGFLLFAATVSCRPAPEHAPPSLLPEGPPPPIPGQTTAALAATDSRGTAPNPGGGLRPAVSGFGPRGRTQGGATIYVRFNQPMVSFDKTNQDRTDVGIELNPKVAGRAYFQTPELLVFEPKEELPLAHRFTALLVGPAESLSGAPLQLPVPLRWEFETPRPRVTGWEVHDLEDQDALRTSPVVLTLDMPTTVAALQPLLAAKAYPAGPESAAVPPPGIKTPPRRSQPLAIRVTQPTEAELKRLNINYYPPSDHGRVFLISPVGLWPGHSEIELTMPPGLPTTAGPLTSLHTFTTTFPTLSPLRLVGADCPPSKPCGLTPIAIRFSNRIPEAQVKKLRIEPRPLDFKASLLDDWSGDGRELNLSGIFMPGTTYRVSLPADFSDKFGQRLGKPTTVTAVIARRPTMELTQSRGILRTGEAQTVGVLTRHVRTLRVRGAVLDDQAAVELLTGWPPPAQDDQSAALGPWPAAPLRQFEHTYTLAPHGPSDWDEVTLDLAALSGRAHRAVLLEVQAVDLVAAAAGQPIPPPQRGLYRLTDLGPVGISSPSQQILAVMRLSSGQPVAGAQLALYQAGQKPVKLGTTDAAGILVVHGTPMLPPAIPHQTPAMLVAEFAESDDHAYLDWLYYHNQAPPKAQAPASELRRGERVLSHIVTERDAYLPGERIRVVGWSALDTPYERSGLRRPRAGTPVTLQLQDARSRTVATHQTQLTAEGKFWAELVIPEPGALGSYTVHARLLNSHVQTQVKVEDFRVPEFSVAATVARPDLLPGEATPVSATATYFFGGPMRILRAAYRQHCVATSYTPPGLAPGWTVGGAPVLGKPYDPSRSELQSLPAGGLGRVNFAVQPPSEGAEQDRRCTVSLALTDASFQTLGAETDYLAHAARYYLALENQKRLLTQGDTERIAVRALALDGTRLAAPGVRVSVVWLHTVPLYKLVDGQKLLDGKEERREPVATCTLALPATGADPSCEFPVAEPGQYELLASGPEKADTRYARSLTTLWVQPRPTQPAAPVSVPRTPPATLELAVSSPQVKPGDTLQVTLRAPWRGASGVLILARNGVREHHPFQFHKESIELTFAVDDTWFPEVSLDAYLVHIGPRRVPTIVRAGGSVAMLQEHRELQVAITAAPESSPGAELPITVQVQDAAHKPCAARIALWAVDEAVLSLTNYSVGNPLADFVPTRSPNASLHDDYRSFIDPFTSSGSDPWFSRDRPIAHTGHMGGRKVSVASMKLDAASVNSPRSRFETTPLFLADIAAGADGVARATVHLPDNLTTFRLTAVASARLVDGTSPGRFGVSDARVRVSAPLIVRAALPRLMRPGDAAEIGALVNNLSGPRGRMQLTVRLIQSGPPSLRLDSPAHVERTLERGDQLRLPLSLVALRPSKTPVVVEVAVTLTPDAAGAPVLRDAVQLPLPVTAEPTLRERVATYGDLTSDAAVRIPVQFPEALRRDTGELTVSASTSLLGGVADAAAELIEYPYGCVEQTASRLLPLVALHDVLKTYPLPLPAGGVESFMDSGIERVLSMQTSTGGFAYWPGGRTPNVYASAYATWVLHLASRSGYPVPPAELGRAADYLQRLVEPQRQGPADGEDGPPDPVPDELLGYDYLDIGRRALAVQVLAELGRPVPRALAELVSQRDQLPLFARALVVLAVKAQNAPAADPRLSAEALGEELLADIAELPGTAHVNERANIAMDELFHSATRTDAMVLLALLRTHPSHPVVAKLARGLLERRGGAGWRNTQETAYAVLALAEFAHLYEHELPALTLRAWLPAVSARPQWEARFSGRSLATQTVELPMAQLLPGLLAATSTGPLAGPLAGPPVATPSGLILQRTGQGRLYYRVGLEWSPMATELPARAQGLRVERRLRSAKGEVTADTLLPPAESVAVDLVIENHALLHYVVVDVPLPAGLEAVQMTLGRGHQTTNLSGEHSGVLSHQEARRDRALLFFDLLPPGTHRHTVYVRTTTPGRYTLPPALAETMYTPELYGRSTSSRVSVTAELPRTR